MSEILSYEKFVENLRAYLLDALNLQEERIYFKVKDEAGMTPEGDRLFVECNVSPEGKEVCGIHTEELYEDYLDGISIKRIGDTVTDEILKCLDSTEGPDYVYTISVQGHGAYPDEQILEDPEITVSGAPTEEENNKWEYYVNEIHEMDNFVKELTDKLADYPEDVVLVMYGDHLPTMGLTVEDLKNKYLFQTEYVMWDNFGLKKKKENLAAYQMAAEVMDRVGIHEGTVFRYHQARRNTRNYQVDLETLQYDLLYGKRYSYGESGESPYLRTRMRMGIYDVTLDSIQCISEADHTYYIKGTEFTPSSEIKLNGEWYDTVYINPTTLMITGTDLNDFDRLAVIQRSNSSTRKALSKSYDRSAYMLYNENKWKIPSEDS